MKPLVIIPARSGSKGVPGKNSKVLKGSPLIQYTLDAALEVFAKHEICVTTDCNKIIEIAKKAGLQVPFVRPSSLCGDDVGSNEVLSHALHYWVEHFYSPDVIVLLQPTSPFRTGEHIKEALKLFSEKIEMVVSVKESKANPYFNLFEENEKGYLEKSKLLSICKRQDAPLVWEYNGAIYVIKTAAFEPQGLYNLKKIVKYKMDEWSSWDIDTPMDWNIAEWYIENRVNIN